MTKRQDQIWREKMLEREKALLRYFAQRPTERPDGSFCMASFREGWDAAIRSARQKRKDAQSSYIR